MTEISSRTIKVQFEGDLRRFAVDEKTVKYEEVMEQIKLLYGFGSVSSGLSLKYKDDEGDMISITSSAELLEALRLSKLETPPILRLIVTNPKYTPSQQLMNAQQNLSPQSAVNTKGATEEEEKEEKCYAPLSPSQWDAPKKEITTTTTYPEPRIVESRPLTIAQDMNNHCMDTVKDVKSFSSSALADMHLNTAAVIASLRLPTVMESIFEVSDLSKEIAAACRDLSRETAQISEAVSKLTKSESISESNQSRDNVNSFSNDALKTTQQFSNETIQMLAKQSQEANKRVECLKEQSQKLAELSRATAEMGSNLSRDTLASGSSASSEILVTIKQM